VNIRNLALEKVAEQVEFPCRFAGCTAFMMAGDKLNHEKHCDFRFAFGVLILLHRKVDWSKKNYSTFCILYGIFNFHSH